MQIVNYQVIAAPDLKHLEKRVKENMADGWQPLGGIAIDRPSSFPFVQALVKLADKTKDLR